MSPQSTAHCRALPDSPLLLRSQALALPEPPLPVAALERCMLSGLCAEFGWVQGEVGGCGATYDGSAGSAGRQASALLCTTRSAHPVKAAAPTADSGGTDCMLVT